MSPTSLLSGSVYQLLSVPPKRSTLCRHLLEDDRQRFEDVVLDVVIHTNRRLADDNGIPSHKQDCAERLIVSNDGLDILARTLVPNSGGIRGTGSSLKLCKVKKIAVGG